ncbi:MAG: hypothetical protein IPJ01_10275 [Micavibrio sp.]|nr:hypothetical protein [Micavibrio sp.]
MKQQEIQLLILNLIQPEFKKENTIGSNGLQLSPISINEDYCKKWNINGEDYVCLTKNGELISNSLYRVGGMGGDIKEDYFLLLKYVESIYDFDFIKKCYPNKGKKELELLRKHLEGHWCIIDKNGIEKKEFDQFKSPYIQKDSCIYSVDSNYYNIETGEFYCNSHSSMTSNEYLFLDNKYDKDESKRGVMKINKKDGTWELFSGK